MLKKIPKPFCLTASVVISLLTALFLETFFYNPTFLSSFGAKTYYLDSADILFEQGVPDENGYIQFDGEALTYNAKPYIIIPHFNENLYNMIIDMQVDETVNFTVVIRKSTAVDENAFHNYNRSYDARTLPSGRYRFSDLRVYGADSLFIYFDRSGADTELNIKINSIELNPVITLNPVRIIVSFLLLLMGFTVLYSRKDEKNRLVKAFLPMGLVFGLIFVFVEVPAQLPDETPHFFRAYYVAEGNLDSIGDLNSPNESSGTMVRADMYNKIMDCFWGTYGHTENVTRFNHMKMDPSNAQYTPLWNSALGAPFLTYLPGALGILIAQALNLPLGWYFYLGRAINLLIYVAIVYNTLKKYPTARKFIFVAALLPMSLRQAGNISPDMLLNAGAFMLIAVTIEEYADKTHLITPKSTFKILILSILLGYLKIVYALLILLIVGVPRSKFPSVKSQAAYKVFLPSAAVLAMVVIYAIRMSGAQYIIPLVDSGAQAHFVLSNPLTYYRILVDTLNGQLLSLLHQSAGWLGWNNVQISNITTSAMWICAVLLFTVDNQSGQSDAWNPTWFEKLVSVITVVVVAAGIISGAYIGWTVYAAPSVEGLQGRYFIPLIPLIYSLFENRAVSISYLSGAMDRAYIILSFSGLLLSQLELISRLYID